MDSMIVMKILEILQSLLMVVLCILIGWMARHAAKVHALLACALWFFVALFALLAAATFLSALTI